MEQETRTYTPRERVVAAYKGGFADRVPAYPIAGSFAGCLDGLTISPSTRSPEEDAVPTPDLMPDDAPISRFPVPDPAALPGDIRQVIEQNATKAGFVPNVFRAYAWKPEHFRAFFHYYEVLMRGESGLSRAEREMIVVAASAANACTY